MRGLRRHALRAPLAQTRPTAAQVPREVRDELEEAHVGAVVGDVGGALVGQDDRELNGHAAHGEVLLRGVGAVLVDGDLGDVAVPVGQEVVNHVLDCARWVGGWGLMVGCGCSGGAGSPRQLNAACPSAPTPTTHPHTHHHTHTHAPVRSAGYRPQ